MNILEHNMIMNLAKVKNEYEWITFLIDIEFMMENKIEVIDIPDFQTVEDD